MPRCPRVWNNEIGETEINRMDLEARDKFSKSNHFQSHMVFGVENEPLATCVAGNKLLLSTLGHSIEVRNLDNYGSLSHSFCTVDLAKQLVYSSVGNYIATLEVKTTRLNLTTHVRLYFNWHLELSGVPMRARIAGRVTPSSQSGVGQLEMVELPLRQQACHVNCCKSTANLIIGCGRCVSIFRFCVKIHPISKIQFQDVEHMLDIYVTFPVKEVALCEEFVACMSSFEVQVIKLIGSNGKNEESDVSLSSLRYHPTLRSRCVVDDENLIVLSEPLQNQCQKFECGSLSPTVSLPSLLDFSRSDLDRCKGPTVIMGPLDYFAGLPTKLDLVDLALKPLKTTSLLYQKFPSILPTNSTPYFCLHSLQFVPFYISNLQEEPSSGAETIANSNCDSFRSSRRCQLRRLEVFFSGQNDGYLYDVSDKVNLISAYNYNCRVYHVSVEHTVLHAVGNTGVHTYSLGNWNRVIQHFSSDKPEKQPSFYNFNLKNVPLGYQPFVGVQLAAFGDGYLVLLTTTKDETEDETSESRWTSYALQCPLAEYVYTNLLEDEWILEGDKREVEEREWYLLHDAHCALAAEVLLYNPPSSSRLFRLFQEASYKLGSIYLKFDSWSAIAFFGMGGGSVNARVKLILEAAKTDCLHEKNKVCLALSLVFLKNGFECLEGLSEEVANSVLKLFSEYEPTLLSALILKTIFQGYDHNLAAELLLSRLNERKCNSVEDTLATCICCVAAGQMECIPTLLISVADESIMNMVGKYPHVWINNLNGDAIQFTLLTQVVQQLKPELFVQILLQLFVHNTVNSVTTALQLCQGDCWEEFGLSSRSDFLLLHFLEEFVKNKYICDEAVITMSFLYLKGLVDETTVLPRQSKPWRLFGARQHWLNKLPPFRDRSFSKESCIMSSSENGSRLKSESRCHCSHCNDCLLRLQSLLSSEAANANVKLKVLKALDGFVGMCGEGERSLRIICSGSTIEGVEHLISTFPAAVVDYCTDNISKCEINKWKEILEVLKEKLANDDNMIVEDLVSHLAEVLNPVELVNLVPNGQFTTQVLRSVSKFQSKQIHNLIVTEGKAMTKI